MSNANHHENDVSGLLGLVQEAGISPGQIGNVTFTAPNGPKMERTVTKVAVRHTGFQCWLYWRWEPTGNTPWGTPDQGYAGVEVDDDLMTLLHRMRRDRIHPKASTHANGNPGSTHLSTNAQWGYRKRC